MRTTAFAMLCLVACNVACNSPVPEGGTSSGASTSTASSSSSSGSSGSSGASSSTSTSGTTSNSSGGTTSGTGSSSGSTSGGACLPQSAACQPGVSATCCGGLVCDGSCVPGDGGVGGACGSATCAPNLACCGGQFCVWLGQDSLNCGGCGIVCGPGLSCQQGACVASTCTSPSPLCPLGAQCCGTNCCYAGEVCCFETVGGLPRAPHCLPADAGTCGTPCLLCGG